MYMQTEVEMLSWTPSTIIVALPVDLRARRGGGGGGGGEEYY